MGMDAEWCVLGAVDAGAPHKRERIWIMAYNQESRGGRLSIQPGGSQQAGVDVGRDGQALADPNRGLCNGWTNQPERQTQGGIAVGGSGEDAANADRVNDDHARHGTISICGEQSSTSEVSGCVAHTGRTGLPLTEQERKYGRPASECNRRESQSGLDGIPHGLAHRLDFSWPPEPAGVPRVATGIQNRVARLKAIGNGQVPQCAALAWRILNE